MSAASGPAAGGVVVPMWFDRPALEARDVARCADRLGFAELWLGEMATFDAFALAGALAATTERVELVVGPLPVATRDPVALALGVASVATLGGRPAHLALGASTATVVSRWHGRPWRDNALRLRETVAALRPVLAGERAAFAGRTVRTDGFRLRLDPPGSDLVVAAFGPESLRVAAEVADRAVLNLVTPAQVRRVRRTLDEAAAAAGRPAPPPLAVWVAAALEPGAEARAQLARQVSLYLPQPGYREMFAEAGFADLVARARDGAPAPASLPDELFEAVGAFGSRAAVLGALEAHAVAGARPAVVPVTAGDPGGARVLAAVAAG